MSVDDFFSKLNPLLAAILRSPLHWLLSPGLVLLTVTGRRTGRRYSIPVGYQRDGEVLTIMVSEAPKKSWWRNFRQPGSIELHLRGRARSGRAELVAPGSDEFRSAASRTLRRMPWLGRVFGIDYDRHKGLDDDQVKRLGEQIAVVRIALDAASE
ncbi:MAG: nitroreductase/quinone reductase family protein [Myxococcota bacterium]